MNSFEILPDLLHVVYFSRQLLIILFLYVHIFNITNNKKLLQLLSTVI